MKHIKTRKVKISISKKKILQVMLLFVFLFEVFTIGKIFYQKSEKPVVTKNQTGKFYGYSGSSDMSNGIALSACGESSPTPTPSYDPNYCKPYLTEVCAGQSYAMTCWVGGLVGNMTFQVVGTKDCGGTTGGSPTPTPGAAKCGNNVKDSGEECDFNSAFGPYPNQCANNGACNQATCTCSSGGGGATGTTTHTPASTPTPTPKATPTPTPTQKANSVAAPSCTASFLPMNITAPGESKLSWSSINTDK
ncbi:MAG: hypothetical protein WCK16_05315, partial [Candidatus Moraniibacteriota bacterium]